jgi:hypothetical protein
VLLVLVALVAGCAHDDDSVLDQHTEALWQAGYGFNNPNADRARKGQPPLNFNGTEARGRQASTQSRARQEAARALAAS